MLSVSLMLGQIYGFCPVLLRLSTTMPEHEYSERMTCVCECGFDYRQASAVRAMLLARAMRSQRAPKNLA